MPQLHMISAKPRVWFGESLRWYLTRARHPFKDFVVGHYWSWFARPRIWIHYDRSATIGVRLGDYLQQKIFFEGHYEKPLVDWLKETLRPDDVFWDVGANIGAVSLIAAERCRRVVAFEPDPRSLDCLRRNIAANSLSNVEIFPCALGDSSTTATLYQSSPSNTGMTSLLAGRGQVVGETAVKIIRADDLVADRPELRPTVVKLDVEGAERLVLLGSRDLLARGSIRALVFEDARTGSGVPANTQVVEQLRSAGYVVTPFAASDVQANDGMYNFLAIPASDP